MHSAFRPLLGLIPRDYLWAMMPRPSRHPRRPLGGRLGSTWSSMECGWRLLWRLMARHQPEHKARKSEILGLLGSWARTREPAAPAKDGLRQHQCFFHCLQACRPKDRRKNLQPRRVTEMRDAEGSPTALLSPKRGRRGWFLHVSLGIPQRTCMTRFIFTTRRVDLLDVNYEFYGTK